MGAKLILFDIGGVLIDYSQVFTTVGRDVGIARDILDQTFSSYALELAQGEISVQNLYHLCIKENTIKADPNYDLLTSWVNDFKTIEEAYKLVWRLASTYKIGLLSNIYRGMVPKMLDRELIPRINYNYKFLSCDLGVAKPNEHIYALVEQTTGLHSRAVLFIDNRSDYLAPAERLGWQTVKFDTNKPKQSVEDVLKVLAITKNG